MANEDIIFNPDTFADKGMAGDLTAPSDHSILLNFNERTYLGFVPDFAPIEIDEFGKANILSHFDVAGDAVHGVHRYTSAPLRLMDALAASNILTTRSPARPSLNGSSPREMHSTK